MALFVIPVRLKPESILIKTAVRVRFSCFCFMLSKKNFLCNSSSFIKSLYYTKHYVFNKDMAELIPDKNEGAEDKPEKGSAEQKSFLKSSSEKSSFDTKKVTQHKKNFRKRYSNNRNPNKQQTSELFSGNVQQTTGMTESKNVVLHNQVISVVIPLYNEEESVTELSQKLRQVFDTLRCNYEVIFIDDGSTDRSFDKIREIHVRNNRFHCIKFRRNYGKSAALAAGFKLAKGDIVITMDSDLQDDPNEIPGLIKTLNSGYDLVSGWKKVRYDPFIKRNTSKIFNYVTSKISGIRLHDFNCGIKGYRKDVIKSLKIYGEMHRYIPALAHLSGFKVTEKIVKHHPRKFGVTKFGANRFLNGFLDLLTVVFTTKYIKKPLHLFGLLGILSFFGGFGITAYLTFMKFFEGASISNRPLFLVGILLIIIGVQFFSLGLIAEMITKSNASEEDFLVETTL